MTSSDNERNDPSGKQADLNAAPRFRQDEVMITSPNAERHPLARSGTIVVAAGALSLYGDNGHLIDSAAVEKISTKHAWLWIKMPALKWDDE